jgi:hypothetical protein
LHKIFGPWIVLFQLESSLIFLEFFLKFTWNLNKNHFLFSFSNLIENEFLNSINSKNKIQDVSINSVKINSKKKCRLKLFILIMICLIVSIDEDNSKLFFFSFVFLVSFYYFLLQLFKPVNFIKIGRKQTHGHS